MRGSVFLVEDDADLLDLYELILEAEGFLIWDACRSGESAIRRYRTAADLPDAVVLDYRLPGCTGLEVARTILARDPTAAIIFATADDTAREAAARLGVRRFKRKPFDTVRLIRNVAAAVAERGACPAPGHRP
ncbi:MAG: response regulator [Deltaproteobacteria bacterium]|nr:response regulator [Deltaproteobacteria bacterium]